MRHSLVAIATLLLSLFAASCGRADQGEFAIYLLKEPMTAAQALARPLGSLQLGERIIANPDIVSYTRATHEIELTAQAYARVQELFKLPVEVAGKPFVVCVGNERIYVGAFWTPLSSLSFDGAYILQPFEPDRRTIRIDLGYPSREAFTGQDPRADPRIMQSLEMAGKLRVEQPAQRLRIRNGGAAPIKSLTVVLPEDRIAFGDVEAGATTDYREAPHGVYAYSAYEYQAGGKVITQPVVDWVGEKPMEGEAFTYTIDLDPSRAPAPQIRLSGVERDR